MAESTESINKCENNIKEDGKEESLPDAEEEKNSEQEDNCSLANARRVEEMKERLREKIRKQEETKQEVSAVLEMTEEIREIVTLEHLKDDQRNEKALKQRSREVNSNLEKKDKKKEIREKEEKLRKGKGSSRSNARLFKIIIYTIFVFVLVTLLIGVFLMLQEFQKMKTENAALKEIKENLEIQLTEFKSGAPCKDAYLAAGSSNVKKLYMPYVGLVDVRCDLKTDGGGWMVILRRSDGSINFDRSWKDYTNGFGNLESEFWIGLEKLHFVTTNQKCELRIDMENFNDEKRFAKYSKFIVGSSAEKYKLTIGGYSGDAGDAFTYHDQKPFSTKDNHSETHDDYNCAEIYNGGWWFHDCYHCHLTGLYVEDEVAKAISMYMSMSAIKWNFWKKSNGQIYLLQFVEMKIRPVE